MEPWFKLVHHGELSTLTRIKVDLPNKADKVWRINLDKSDAQLPPVLADILKSFIKSYTKSQPTLLGEKELISITGQVLYG